MRYINERERSSKKIFALRLPSIIIIIIIIISVVVSINA